MRATIHNGRTGKDGAYNTKHNDRQFDISHAEHIDPERMKNNKYWNWTGNPEMSFEDAEAAFYEKHISAHLDAQNARYRAQRHAERAKTINEYRRSPQTCPEEVILMIGKAGDTIPADMMARIIQEQINWEQKQFPGVKVLDVALHMDEQGAPHIHERRAWVYTDKDGNLAISQNKSLEQMGVELPNPDRPRGRFNNRKQVFSRMCREHLLQICREHGLKIEEIPQEKSRSGLSHIAYMTRQEEKKANNLYSISSQLENKIHALQINDRQLDSRIKKKNLEYRNIYNNLLTAEKELDIVRDFLTKTEQRRLFQIYQQKEHERTR